VRASPLQGIDEVGNPVYSIKTSINRPNPSPFDDWDEGDINRLIDLWGEDTMILCGYTKTYPNSAQD